MAFLWPWVGLLWVGRRKADVGQTAGPITGRAGGGGVVTLQLGLGCWGTRRSSSPVAGIGGLIPAAVHLRGGAPRWWSRRSGRGRTRFWSSKRIVIRGRKDVRRPWKPRLPIRPLGSPCPEQRPRSVGMVVPGGSFSRRDGGCWEKPTIFRPRGTVMVRSAKVPGRACGDPESPNATG